MCLLSPIQDHKLTEPSVGCRKLLYLRFKLQAGEKEVSATNVSSACSLEHANKAKLVRPLWPAGGNRRATDEEVEYSGYMYLSMLEWS